MQPINTIFPLHSQPKKVIVTMHQKPDADAMGSSLAMYHYLTQLGHSVNVISPTNWASFLNWMPGCRAVLDYESRTEKCNQMIKEADWIFCLDFNILVRTKKMEEPIMASVAQKILIDHHREPQEAIFAYGISDTGKSSTSEMIYDLILAAGHQKLINDDIQQCIYAGVMTDTGSFRFPSTTASVHTLVADLKKRGLQHSIIHENLYDNFLENRFRFFGHVLLNRMEVYYEFNTALIAITQQDLIKFDVKTGDTEGLVNFPLSILGIKLACIIIDRGEERKSSFRSKGDFDVNEFARKYFNGGGHFNAAGGQNKEPLDEVVQLFKKAIVENAAALGG